MSVLLREYQIQAVQACRDALERGKRRMGIVLPCGTGKTITAMSAVASALRKGNDCLWLCNREELVSQAVSAFQRVAPEMPDCVGVVKADENDIDARLVVASIQTISGRDRAVERERARLDAALDDCQPSEVEGIQAKLNALPPPSFPRLEDMRPDRFKMVVYDEFHHASSRTSKDVLKRFGPDVFLLGLSATPERADGLHLGAIFTDGVVYSMDLKTAIRRGYICHFEYRSVWLDMNRDAVKSTAGDFNVKQLEDVLEQVGSVEASVKGILAHAADRKCLVFTLSIDQSKRTAEGLRAAGLKADYVSCETPNKERKRILADFKANRLRFVCSAGVLTEGFDEESADCAVLCRPTKSKVLYVQQIGRVLRLFPGKSTALVLDFTRSGSRQKPVTVEQITGIGQRDGETSEQAEKRIEEEKVAAGLPRDTVAAAMLAAAERAREKRKQFAAAWTVLKSPPKGVVEARAICGSNRRKAVIWTDDGESWRACVWLTTAGGYYKIENYGVGIEFAQDLWRHSMEEMGQKILTDGSTAWRTRKPSPAMLGMAEKWRVA